MEIEYTNQMLLNVIKQLVEQMDETDVERIRICSDVNYKNNSRISIDIDTKTPFGKAAQLRTGDKIKVIQERKE